MDGKYAFPETNFNIDVRLLVAASKPVTDSPVICALQQSSLAILAGYLDRMEALTLKD